MLAVLVVLLSHRLLRLWTPVLYLGAVAGLVAVLSPLGTTINGSHSWIVLPGGFSVQPSELAKVAMVLGMALVLVSTQPVRATGMCWGRSPWPRFPRRWSSCSPTSARSW